LLDEGTPYRNATAAGQALCPGSHQNPAAACSCAAFTVILGIIGFFLQKYFTFQSRGKIDSREIVTFFAVITIGLLNDSVLAFGVGILRWWYMAASA
jgi:putative flippase GtrA